MSKPTVTNFKTEPSLVTLQDTVGGWIEAIPCIDGRLMYANEDGRMKQLPINERASELAGRIILGSVAVIGGQDEPSN
tara:strand:+ start:62 stop:295 length:234 start_codon:yes stop_codon:yes gene_type:complete